MLTHRDTGTFQARRLRCIRTVAGAGVLFGNEWRHGSTNNNTQLYTLQLAYKLGCAAYGLLYSRRLLIVSTDIIWTCRLAMPARRTYVLIPWPLKQQGAGTPKPLR
jgi:hypothetical protein